MSKVNLIPKALRVVLALSALWIVPAGAVSITDTIDPTNTLVTTGSIPSPCPAGVTCTTSALTFVHDLTDQGFNVGLDIITGATISIHLMEQVVSGLNNETFRYDIGLNPQSFTCSTGNCVPNGGITSTITLDAAALADLAADGKISVTVTSLTGNLLFADALLTVQVADFTDLASLATSVPEPAPILLIAAGLVALGWRRRGLN